MTDNELIAEFMGMVQNPHDPTMFTEAQFYVYEDGQHFGLWRRSAFSTSWDWLMPVVEKIEDLEEPHPSNNPTKGTVWPYQFEILSRCVVQVIDNRDDSAIVTIDEQHHRKLDSVYKAVVEFIKWYNSQNP